MVGLTVEENIGNLRLHLTFISLLSSFNTGITCYFKTNTETLKKMSIKVFSLAILASLLCLSCSETTTDYESSVSTTTSTKALTTYDVDIEVSTETPSNQPATRANMP